MAQTRPTIAETGLPEGEKMVARIENGTVILEPFDLALRRARSLVRQYVPEGVSLVDELIAERHDEPDMSKAVLDSSAVMAVLLEETGAERYFAKRGTHAVRGRAKEILSRSGIGTPPCDGDKIE